MKVKKKGKMESGEKNEDSLVAELEISVQPGLI
jgi:hypothetical protein